MSQEEEIEGGLTTTVAAGTIEAELDAVAVQATTVREFLVGFLSECPEALEGMRAVYESGAMTHALVAKKIELAIPIELILASSDELMAAVERKRSMHAAPESLQ